MSFKQEIYEYPGFLTQEECNEYITLIRNKQARNFTDSGAFTNKIWTDPELAFLFRDRTAKYNNGMAFGLAANDVIMAGMYKPGDSFSIHTDTGLFFDLAGRKKTRYTLLIYLNDEFEGGNTIFYDTDTWAVTKVVKPERGKALIFDIDLWHSGEPLISGSKMWIGCEIIDSFNPVEP
jgi:hypothetical protein